ncbi:MAG: DUF2384 domain-containing protein [Halobacteriovoraceae bacterium]|jgi:hypothetical protein|nr:DUF2384 domain-containing protein [Halobacteriovoraceae bacterium]
MTAEVLQSVDFFESNDLYLENSSEIDLTALAKLLEMNQKDLAKAFDINESQITRNAATSDNKFVKQWMTVFNMLTGHIQATEPEISQDKLRLKMSRWLKMPSSHFSNDTPLSIMVQGKARRVIKLLEQITA